MCETRDSCQRFNKFKDNGIIICKSKDKLREQKQGQVDAEATGAGHVEIESCTRNFTQAGPATRPRGTPHTRHNSNETYFLKGRGRHGSGTRVCGVVQHDCEEPRVCW